MNFSSPDPNDNGVRHPEYICTGQVSPLIWIQTIDQFVEDYIGILPKTNADWLSVSEHKLLSFVSGKLFVDMLGLEKVRDELCNYPKDVTLYLIASQWAMIAQEQAFVKRTFDCFDDIGSRIICARIVERLMRLCFLYKGKYAPYSKWFGTAFQKLDISEHLKDVLQNTLSANTIDARESYLVKAQQLIIQLHNDTGLTERFNETVQNYFGRDIQVLFVDELAGLILEQISDEELKKIPLIGTFSQVGNFTDLADDSCNTIKIKSFYREFTTDGRY